MKIRIPADELIVLPGGVREKLREASAPELKVLIYLYAKKEAETPEIASALGIPPGEVEAAFAFWRGAGLIEPDDSGPKKAVPSTGSLYKSYDSHTISEFLLKEDFRTCCDIVGEKLGKQLTKNDYSSLVYLCDYVGLPPEMISGLAEYCVAREKRSMQYLVRTALAMYEQDGVDTYEKFERHLARLEQIGSSVEKVRRLCGFGDRELTAKEKNLLDRWFGEWELKYELVRLAYEKTVDSLGKVSLSYMNGMLKRWYESGWTTPEEVGAKDKKPGNGDGSEAGYGDGDAFFEAALKAGMAE